jgi:small subunit ribosomal protein S16
MAVKVRLARGGSKKRPFYNIVAIDSRKKRDGKPLEYLGYINPVVEEETAQRKAVHVETEKLEKWIETGAAVSESLAKKLKKFGISGMEKFIPQPKTEYLGVTKKAKKADLEQKLEEQKKLAKAKADQKKAAAAQA